MGRDMRDNMRALRKTSNEPSLCFTDVHWAAEQAMLDARAALGLSRPKLAQHLGIAHYTVKRWETGETTIQPLVFERLPQFATAWREAFEARKAEIRRAA